MSSWRTRLPAPPVIGAHTLEELVGHLKRPRRVMMMVKAGGPVDAVIEQLVPLLEPGDIIIDGGNSHYQDTRRRTADAGGAGPALRRHRRLRRRRGRAATARRIMPGGAPEAWPHVKPIFQAIAAKVDRRHALLRLGRRRRRRPLRQDGPQRHRVRRHAADLRGLPPDEGRAGACPNDEMHQIFAGWNEGDARLLPDRDHARHPRLPGRGRRARCWT